MRVQAPRRPASDWAAFLRGFGATALGLAALLYGIIAALDPYGSRVAPGRAPVPIMDVNQRYMYPQLVRSGRFDGAILGTSTIRLVDPAEIGGAFGARVVNLGLNAGTPWEQTQLAGLFLDVVPAPAFVLFSLDPTWCEADADSAAKRLTYRSFPPWLYDRDPLNDYAHLVNLRTLEIAGRLALHRLGRQKERIRADGYEVFTPREDRYDLARARTHIWGEAAPPQPNEPALALSEAERRALSFPALSWLEALLARLPAATRAIVMFPPVHVAAQPRPGSREAALDEACKERATALAHLRRADVVDFRVSSPVTRDDANYWDRLHYRLPIAARIAAGLEAAAAGRAAPDGFYRLR